MQEWPTTDACDGFNVIFSQSPGGLDDIVDLLVPGLRRRRLFRRDYAGTTQREHLGLARPADRFTPVTRRDRPTMAAL